MDNLSVTCYKRFQRIYLNYYQVISFIGWVHRWTEVPHFPGQSIARNVPRATWASICTFWEHPAPGYFLTECGDSSIDVLVTSKIELIFREWVNCIDVSERPSRRQMIPESLIRVTRLELSPYYWDSTYKSFTYSIRVLWWER